jgi:hypothetical protein
MSENRLFELNFNVHLFNIAGMKKERKASTGLLRDLQTHLDAMSETYRKQSALSARYERSSRFWRTFTLIAVPAVALLGGGLVWALK